MGVTIGHQLGQTKVLIAGMLDRTETIAKQMQESAAKLGISFEIFRESPYKLLINIGHCETLGFNFKSVKEIMEEKEYSYERSVLTGDGKIPLKEGYRIEDYPQNEIWYCADFCKTQFAHNLIEHKMVADLVRSAAMYCVFAKVSDEGDYYHSGILQDAAEAISENGALIAGITGQLTGMGWQTLTGGETKIGKSKNKKSNV